MGRPDLMPRELTREQALQAFDYECNLRLKIIDVLEQTLNDSSVEATHEEDMV